MASPGPITIGITTRDRPESLERCLLSLECALDLAAEIIVVDDASAIPMTEALAGKLPPVLASRTRITRWARQGGYIVARNHIVEAASEAFVLLLDDDTRVLDRQSLVEGIRALESSPEVAAVAFAQAEADGIPWAASMQPAPVDYPCYVPAFIGFAHLISRDVFRAVGGYRGILHFYGEEKEFCLRLLDAGHAVVYLPAARIAHVPDSSGRSDRKYLRYVVRNDCLNALLNEPWSRALWTVPARLARYFRMRRLWRIDDPGGFRWIVGELVRNLDVVWRDRRPVRAATLRRWRELRRVWPAFAHVEGMRP